ncbi:hypothetical protein JTE90_023895 [Oedothorax gibbosus]|uniref:Uncharacterized protein n=1 Tax=Oedothorax gibbosus TaxID=931172 RepID=A0AAV6ULZ5_9ARAC|nr:hypothetical protein JTE90_023895 [Oedothorax gibbosus]
MFGNTFTPLHASQLIIWLLYLSIDKMPPKGRGRGKAKQDAAPPPGRGPGQPQGRGAPQERPEQAPPGDARPRGIYQPPAEPQQAAAPPPQQAAEKPKMRTVNPEELGIELKYNLDLAPALPRRPGFGTRGRKVALIVNHFPVDLPSGNVYHYDVEIVSKRKSTTTAAPGAQAPSDKEGKKYRAMNTKRNREVIDAMTRGHDLFKGMLCAYDGKKNLYSRKPLRIGIGKGHKCEVVLPDENPGDPEDPRGPRMDNFEVTIKPVQKKDTNDCSISLDPLHMLFAGKVKEVPQDAVMAIETVLRHGPCMRFTPVGRSFFYPPNPSDVHPLGGGKEIWFGYHQSLRLGQWKPTVNLDITATTFYSAQPVMKYIEEMLGGPRRANLDRPLRDSDITRLSKDMKNMRIETNHLRRYKRKYRILRFTREPANRLEFKLTIDNREVTKTVAQYFADNYGPLRFPHLPCIQGNPEAKKVYLPIEVCDIVEGQHCKKKLEERQNAEMIKFTARPPRRRFDEIKGLVQRANYSHDQFLREFGIKVYNEPMKLEGRVLDAPNVRYQKGPGEVKIMPRDGQWDMRNLQYFRGSVIQSWVLLNFSNPSFCNSQALGKFASLLSDIGNEQGIQIGRPASVETVDLRRTSVNKVLNDVKNRYNADLAVCVVPVQNKSIYGELKQAAETVLGLVTQCIKDENVVKKCNPPLVSNLCQKINAKTGGVNNSLTPGETPPILRRPVIIIGADVTHPGPSQDIKPSIAAAVGSLDAHPSRYAVTIRAQVNVDVKKQSVEVIIDLKGMVLDLLKAFYRNTKGKKPEKIIFYRDGVSEGQFQQVRSYEVKSIREACKTLDPEYQPGITFICVQKRHHTRFMPQDDRQGSGKMKNIQPGTVVDTTVSHPVNFDFFLCSHFGLQGTSRPCHYCVIEDDNNLTPDELQTLTYYLCHTYVRCTKSISSPAPVMYAHLAAFRARQHLLTQMDESSSASIRSTGSEEWHDISDAVKNAIKVLDSLKNTMYFV